jgi:hypothetical protein
MPLLQLLDSTLHYQQHQQLALLMGSLPDLQQLVLLHLAASLLCLPQHRRQLELCGQPLLLLLLSAAPPCIC